MTAEGGLAAGGHVGFRLHLVNAAGRACSLVGYPQAVLVDSAGRAAQSAAPTARGYLGGVKDGGRPPTVVLQPGAEATSLVEGEDVSAASVCRTVTGVRVGLPRATGKTAAVIEKGPFLACPGVTVHPVLAGATGTQ